MTNHPIVGGSRRDVGELMFGQCPQQTFGVKLTGIRADGQTQRQWRQRTGQCSDPHQEQQPEAEIQQWALGPSLQVIQGIFTTVKVQHLDDHSHRRRPQSRATNSHHHSGDTEQKEKTQVSRLREPPFLTRFLEFAFTGVK